MYMAAGALLLWAVTTARGLSPALDCNVDTTLVKPLNPPLPCSVTIENGHVHAVCKILTQQGQGNSSTDEYPNAMTIENRLVSNEPLGAEVPVNASVCLSLRSVKVKKWVNFRLEKNQKYDLTLQVAECYGPSIRCHYFPPEIIHQMTYETTLGVPQPAAVAVCMDTRGGRGCNFGIKALMGAGCFDATYFLTVRGMVPEWGPPSAKTEFVNITLASRVIDIPIPLSVSLNNSHIEHIIFYKCNIDSIGEFFLPTIIHLERLEFFHTPIEKVDLNAFILNPYIRYSSFVGTDLPGIPQAIFDLKRLETLDMSDTNLPPDTEFQYCPGNCESNSSVQHLILSRTNLTSLPDRAFCGFPLLKRLELENCHITKLSGSPFECLVNLQNLTMAGNKIRSLGGENVKGLRNLTFLNLSENKIARFEGQQIFSALISLRSLILSKNEITNLLLDSVEYAPIEQLNLAENGITGWKPPLFTRMNKLETLHLQNNGLSSLNEDMLHDVSHVKYVNFSFNPWDCSSCELNHLRFLLDKHPSKCRKCFLCKEPDEHEGMYVLEAPPNEEDCAPPDYCRSYGVPALLLILMASVVGYAVYRNRWYCMYGMLYLKVAVKGSRRQAQDGRFLFDGFLSYHSSDAKWVRDVLLPKLESVPMGFRFCVAEQNFVPGVPITENICRAIAKSRVSLFVLSQEFCRSRWCMFELNLAQHRLFENARDDSLVLIKKSDLEVSEMSSTLTYPIKSRTYVQLPPDGSSEALYKLFWLQVQAALEN